MRALLLLIPLGLVACGGKSDDDAESGGKGGSAGSTMGGTGADGGAFTGGTGGTGGTDASGGKGGATGGKGGATSGGSSGSSTGGTTGGTTGGVSGTAGDAGTSGTSGTAGVGGDGMACCLAFPTCGENETQIDSLDDCPAGAMCHEVSLCCSTIYCATMAAQCDAIPTCDPGDSEVKSCGDAQPCYSRTLCGTSILCLDDACDPDTEYWLNYVAMGDACAVVDYACPDHTDPFTNDCGCGCAQSRDCPQFVDCSPGPEPRPECNDEALAKCPYTIRAL